MAATNAIIGYDSTLEVETSPGVWFEFEEVLSIGLPNEEQEELDATHMKSPNRTRETIPGFINPGELPVTMNWIPGSLTDEYIVAWKAAQATRNMKVTTPNGKTFTFPSFPKGYDTPLENEGKLTATLNVKVAGAVTRGTAA